MMELVLVMDMPGRIYLELPEHLDVTFAGNLDLPDGTPVLLWAGDVISADPLAVFILAIKLARRWVGFFGLDLTAPGAWGTELLQQIAGNSITEAA